MKKKISLGIIAVAMLFFISCKESVKENKPVNKDCKNVHWSHHKGEEGPENWQNLCTGFSDCAGKVQSPINIETKDVSNKNNLVAPIFSYGTSKVAIVNNSHTVQFNIFGENNVNLNGKDYKLLQFHYHAKSEHTINGKHYPIEVHFVHKHSDSDFAVLGIMFKEGKENKLLAKYLDKFPTIKGVFKSEDTIAILSLFPKDKSYYNYKGSLTTPPCSEVVNWYVLKTPLTASKGQIEQFSKILNNNYRPIQSLNDRTVASFIE